jgi:nucleoside recognition membrane protein YjiH
MIFFIIIFIGLLLAYLLVEIDHCRKGHDVYDWTKALVKWIDRNDA